jgi:CRISPR-associated protein Csb2
MTTHTETAQETLPPNRAVSEDEHQWSNSAGSADELAAGFCGGVFSNACNQRDDPRANHHRGQPIDEQFALASWGVNSRKGSQDASKNADNAPRNTADEAGLLVSPPRNHVAPGWRYRSHQFRRARNRPRDDGYSRPFGAFRLTFPEAVAGPICLGYACHFGMGVFRPLTCAG